MLLSLIPGRSLPEMSQPRQEGRPRTAGIVGANTTEGERTAQLLANHVQNVVK